MFFVLQVKYTSEAKIKPAFNKHVSVQISKKMKQEKQQLSFHRSRNASSEPPTV
jgi:hypothetical protein